MKMIIDIPDNELKDPLKNIHLLISNGIITEVCIKKYDKDKPYFMDLNYAPLSESDDCISRLDAINIVVCDILSSAIVYGRTEEGMAARKAIVEGLKRLPPVTPAEKEEPCTDAISREDALMALTGEYTDSPIEILPKAIKRINALPPVKPTEKQEPCDDAISRQAVIEVIEKCHCEEWVKADIGAPIEALQPVNSAEKVGHWIDDNKDEIDAQYGRHLYRCQICDKYAEYFVGGTEDWWDIEKPNYCPSCGARMGGEQNEID